MTIAMSKQGVPVNGFFLAAGAALIFAVAVFALPPAALSQNRQFEDLSNRLERIERELRAVNRQVLGGQGSGPSAEIPVAGSNHGAPSGIAPGGNAYIIRLEQRLGDLERDVRNATGEVEGLTHTLNQITSRLDKIVSDMEFRLENLERGGPRASAVAPTVPPSPSAVPAPGGVQQVGPSTGRAVLGDGSRALGTISQGDLSRIQSAADVPRSEQQAARPPAEPPAPSTILPEGTVKSRYDFAISLLSKGDYGQAELAFKEFLTSHGSDPLAANAQYWLGESFYVRQDYRTAAETFLRGYQSYPKGAKAPDTLLKLGMSLTGLDKKEEACAAFDKLAEDFPDAPGNIKKFVVRERGRASC